MFGKSVKHILFYFMGKSANTLIQSDLKSNKSPWLLSKKNFNGSRLQRRAMHKVILQQSATKCMSSYHNSNAAGAKKKKKNDIKSNGVNAVQEQQSSKQASVFPRLVYINTHFRGEEFMFILYKKSYIIRYKGQSPRQPSTSEPLPTETAGFSSLGLAFPEDMK